MIYFLLKSSTSMNINKNIIILLLAISSLVFAQAKNAQIKCDDLLSIYAQKPKELKFVKCEMIKDTRIIMRATYKVLGKKSKEVEDFLVKTYGMGRLKWACCGWDSGGKYGVFKHEKFKKINQDCLGLISMYTLDQTQDRDKVDFFTIIVELAVI